jgi:hypothetical protein
MIPAYESLETRDPVASKIDQRLEREGKLASLDCVCKVRAQRLLAQQLDMHGHLEEAV